MSKECLTIIKEQIKESRRCIDRAAWYLKIPCGHEIPDGLRTLAAVETLKAIRELSQAAAIMLDPEQAVLQSTKNGCECFGLCVNNQSENQGICHISEPTFQILQNVKKCMNERKTL